MDKINVFELENVSFSYPYEKPVLKCINMKVRQGEKVAILGANGCGKSTLLRLLSGLLTHQYGKFKAFGVDVDPGSLHKSELIKQYHSKVGFIFQDSDAQLFCSTVREEIAFGLLQLGLPKSEVRKRIKDILELLGISHLEEKVPFKLSGGEKKKVAIAAVLLMNPTVLILDEPTNGLDPRTQRWLVQLLVELNRAGKTIITSTHNLELVQELSERAVVFSEEHEIAADGPTAEILGDIELLKRVNLVDEFYHRHSEGSHSHYHIHNF